MIYEMRTYTIAAGELPTVVKNSGEVGREARGDNFGKLEGYWVTEIGPLGQVMHLWSYESFDERVRLREALSKHKPWVEDYLPLVIPRLVRQDIRLMTAFLPFKPPTTEGNVYEFRNYRTQPGKAKAWAKLFAEVMPHREKHSPNVCAWHTDAGQPNEVCHMWVYPDLNARMAARGAAGKDEGWRGFLGSSVGFIAEAHSTILVPAAHSPMK